MLLEEQKQPVGEALAEPCMEQSWAPMHLTVWNNVWNSVIEICPDIRCNSKYHKQGKISFS